jgi:hypothetical protein
MVSQSSPSHRQYQRRDHARTSIFSRPVLLLLPSPILPLSFVVLSLVVLEVPSQAVLGSQLLAWCLRLLKRMLLWSIPFPRWLQGSLGGRISYLNTISHISWNSDTDALTVALHDRHLRPSPRNCRKQSFPSSSRCPRPRTCALH